MRLPTLLIMVASTGVIVACRAAPAQRVTPTSEVVVVTEESSQDDTATQLPGSAEDTAEVFPTPYVCQAEIVEQAYEHGRMFWVGRSFQERCQQTHDFAVGSGEIWVLILNDSGEGGRWLAFEDDWNGDAEIPFDLTMTQPAGLLQPVRGFGKVWREKLAEDDRLSLGWATGPELKFITEYRYDAGGFVDADGVYIPRPGQHTISSVVGERFFLDEQTGRFEYIPAD